VTLEHATEELPSAWERVLHSGHRYLALVHATLFDMAARGHIVLVGRGAALALRTIPGILRVRVTAPEQVRAHRVADAVGITAAAALHLVRRSDHERAARIKFLYHVDWNDPHLYDAVLNTERVPVGTAVEMLRATFEQMRAALGQAPDQEVADSCIAGQVQTLLLARGVTRAGDVEVACSAGVCHIRGVVAHEWQRQRVEDVVGAIPGVTDVVNEIEVEPAVPPLGDRVGSSPASRVFPWEL
jgi:hypothetical protein